MISRNVMKQVVDQTNIVEIVGEVVKLTKRGSSYFGLCPFHDDKNPSMSVSGEKKIFNCFSCNTKGDVITFYSKFNNISKDQATIQLAKRLGIEVSEATSKEAIIEERLLKVMDEATKFYAFYLNNSEEGIIAKEYLAKRGINEELIKELRIGLAPAEKNYLHLALNQVGANELDQIELGLVKNNEKNEIYDVFRNRIMFPVDNLEGKVVGFSGRIYTESNQAKYINSTENKLFHKGQILYNFKKASQNIRKQDEVIIFEGFMDVIAGLRADILNTVATMGTALTNDHINTLLKLTKNIVLCFDGDEAGLHAMKRSAMLFANFQIIPKAIVLPDGLDPDEYLNKYGKDSLKEYFDTNKKNVYMYLYDLAKKDYIKDDLESREKFKKEVFEFVRFSKQNSIVEYFLKLLANDIDVSFESLLKDFGKLQFKVAEVPVYNEIINEPDKILTKPIIIKKKVFVAYDCIIKHILYSKNNFYEYKNKIGTEFYLDSRLSIYFEFIKKMEVFYAEHDKMDDVDFHDIAKNLDVANQTTKYSEFAKHIFNDALTTEADKAHFFDCLQTVLNCIKDLNDIRTYNKAITTKNDEDIKKFEEIRRQNVKILPKED